MLGWKDFVGGILVPGAVTAVVLMAAWRWSRHRRSARESRSWAGTAALAAGFAAGYLALLGWPGFPPLDAVDWLLFLAGPLAALGLVEAYWRMDLAGRTLVMALAVPAALLLVARPLLLASGANDVGPLLLGATAVSVAAMLAAEVLAERTSAARLSAILLAVAAPAALVLLLSGSARLGMIGGALAAAQAGGAGGQRRAGTRSLGPGDRAGVWHAVGGARRQRDVVQQRTNERRGAAGDGTLHGLDRAPRAAPVRLDRANADLRRAGAGRGQRTGSAAVDAARRTGVVRNASDV